MTVATRLNALDDRVMPVIVRPLRAFSDRHPVAVRRIPLISTILVVAFAVLELTFGHPESPWPSFLLIFIVVPQYVASRRRASKSSTVQPSH